MAIILLRKVVARLCPLLSSALVDLRTNALIHFHGSRFGVGSVECRARQQLSALVAHSSPDSSSLWVVSKRGKATKPPRIRHDYTHEHNVREQRNEGVNPEGLRTDGLPVFNLFVRAHRRHVSCEEIVILKHPCHGMSYHVM